MYLFNESKMLLQQAKISICINFSINEFSHAKRKNK